MKRSGPPQRKTPLAQGNKPLKRSAPLNPGDKGFKWATYAPTSKTCPQCTTSFRVKPSEAMRRKFCSRKCMYAANAAQQRVSRVGTGNPNFKGGKRAGVRSRAGESRWYAALGTCCQHPQCRTPRTALNLHHLVYEQHVRREGGDRWDPRNGLTLCVSCHTSHHRRGDRVVPLSALPDAALDFAFELLGPGAYDYLLRRYAGTDARVNARLAEAARS